MSARYEKLLELANKELAENNTNQQIYRTASLLAVGDEQRTRELYVKLRVDQLQREQQQAIADFVRSSWNEIISGRPFVCPHCENRAIAKRIDSEFFSTLFKSKPWHQYSCSICGIKLSLCGSAGSSKSVQPSLISGELGVPSVVEKSSNVPSLIGFILSLFSVVLFFIGIIPLLAVILSAIGLATFEPEKHKNKWMAAVGLALGAIFTLMYMGLYGHI